MLPIPQRRLEELLTARAIELGATIRRGNDVIGIDLEPDSVSVRIHTTAGTDELTAGFVVGCDGARSFVRHHAGIGFPGITSDETSRIGRVVLPLADIEIAGDVISIRQGPRLNLFRPNRTPAGVITIAPVAALDPTARSDLFLVSTKERREPADEDGVLTVADFEASIQRVLGVTLPTEHVEWARATVANSRQAETYRSGRLFLAGDAAHIFSAGGSALNVGLLDAVNLGWKLAAAVQGRSAPDLLDTYQAERHPAGAQALSQTRVQSALSAPGENAAATRELLTDLLRLPAPLGRLAEIMEGAAPEWAPDLATTGPIKLSIDSAMRRGRALLIDGSSDHVFTTIAEPWRERVELIDVTEGLNGMLIRPDGYLAWSAADHSQGSTDELAAALNRWFGPAHPPTR